MKQIVQTADQMDHLIQNLLGSDCYAVDTETNYTDTDSDRFCVGISLATAEDEWYIPVGHRADLFGDQNYKDSIPVDLLQHGSVIFHNAKFDLRVLGRVGLCPPKEYEDTMLMSWVCNEHPPHDLKELAGIILKVDHPKQLLEAIGKARSIFGQEGIPVDLMAAYATNDARWTYDLFVHYKKSLKDEADLSVLRSRYEYSDTLSIIEDRGILVDKDQCRVLSIRAQKRMLQIVQELGFDPTKRVQLERKLFSIPPVGLGLPKPPSLGKTSAPTLNAAYLASVGHPVTALVLEYRRLTKARSSYFEAYPKRCDPDGRLHPTFKLHGTKTGRLSCENPNLQQIPREATQEDMNIKKLFLPPDDYELWEFDYSNIELRMAAAYSKEPTLISAFRDNDDLHQRVAGELGISRHEAKTCNFLLLYGGRANKLDKQIHCGMRRAKEIVDKYIAQYPKLFALIDRCEDMAAKRGYIKTWTGRKRHLQYRSEAWLAFNSLIQGGCGDVLQASVVDLVRQGYEVCNLVHDSVWIQIPVGEVEQQSEKIQTIMTDWTEPKFGVSFVTDKKRLN